MGLFADTTHATRALTLGAGLSDAEAAAFMERARPALTFLRQITPEADVTLGASKIGGRPDMAADIPWRCGRRCRLAPGLTCRP